MRAQTATQPARSDSLEVFWHLSLIVVVSTAFESLFLDHGIAWLFDEGWPLYAAMQLHAGGTLYADVFFLFPPGHVLPAWIAYALDPPGLILARVFYSAFNVALCIALYFLGRRIMRPPFALLAALLLAVAAPRSHLTHLLFGYRYLVFSVLALLAYSARLQTGNRAWLAVAGCFTGVALYFRLTPAFAVGCGIAIAVMGAGRGWRNWLRDWSAYAAGMALIVVPVLAWFATGVGLEALWEQSVVRILPLQTAQSKPIPELVLPGSWDRELISRWFVPVQYWLYSTVYAAYAVVLGIRWWRTDPEERGSGHALLVAIVIWGGLYSLRAVGRSDEHHLTSAIPPACLLLAHLVSLGCRPGARPRDDARRRSPVVEWSACVLALGAWVLLLGSDRYLDVTRRGVHPIASLGDRVRIADRDTAERLDRSVARIERLTRPRDTILDLTHSPLLYVLANRRGPGYGDIVTPGVFADPEDEQAFVERLQQAPPALVLWPSHPFDGMPSRALEVQAPLLSQWVADHYVRVGGQGFREITMMRRD